MSREKRSSTRYIVALPLQVVRDGVEVEGMTNNLSLGGTLARVELPSRARIGERVKVSFLIPELDQPLVAQAPVRWVSDVDSNVLGLQFVTGFRARETWALGRFLEKCTPE